MAPYIASATSYPIVNTYVPHTPLENAEAFFGIMGCAVAFLGYAFVFEDGVFGAAGKFLFGLKLGEVNTFNEEVRDATEADFAVRPRSGRYVGASTEDDGGDQGVTTDLEFGAGGTITGSGRDSEDGRYTLSGRWGPPAEPQEVARCAWIERYPRQSVFGTEVNDAFDVAVTASVLKNGNIDVLFCSSIGVSGSVVLKRRRGI